MEKVVLKAEPYGVEVDITNVVIEEFTPNEVNRLFEVNDLYFRRVKQDALMVLNENMLAKGRKEIVAGVDNIPRAEISIVVEPQQLFLGKKVDKIRTNAFVAVRTLARELKDDIVVIQLNRRFYKVDLNYLYAVIRLAYSPLG